MKRLELFIVPEGSIHYFMVVDGHNRSRHSFGSSEAEAMYDQAIVILSDTSFESELRIIDAGRRYLKATEMKVSLGTLKSWQAAAAEARK